MYKEKYMKYKQKYLAFARQSGGVKKGEDNGDRDNGGGGKKDESDYEFMDEQKLIDFNEKMEDLKNKDSETKKDDFRMIKRFMEEEVFPFLEQFRKEAIKYREQRDENNKKLFTLMAKQYKSISREIRHLDFARVKIMSSINAKLNLADGDSDIDFGIIIKGLNNGDAKCIDLDKYTHVAQILIQNGFKFIKTFNAHDIFNQYFSFEQDIDGVEFELKIRDYNASKPILALHKFLDNELTDDQITMLTYAKFLFKNLDKKNPSHESYGKFKSILFNWAFSGIEGAFKLNS
jgi:hypothetical protein